MGAAGQLAAAGAERSATLASGHPAVFVDQARFEVHGLLGSGGFGKVYDVFDRKRSARVAVKVITRSDTDSLYQFKREFRSLTELLHPNLVQLYELNGLGQGWYFTMELVHGQDARSYVRAAPAEQADSQTSPLPSPSTQARAPLTTPRPAQRPGPAFQEARLRSVFRQLAEALCFLHESGKLHGDIKPSNVLVTPEGRVVLLDFGLAQDITHESDQGSGVIQGTPRYMAPEQALGEHIGPAADWYAVGVMLYEMLTGSAPFDGSVSEILYSKVSLQAPTQGRWSDSLPVDLVQLSIDLLQHAPTQRPVGIEVLARLGQGTQPAAAATRKARAQFIGRARELGMLRTAFATSGSGRNVVALAHGGSGMGKSALIAQLFGELRVGDPEIEILAGRCFEQESVPYKALDILVDALSGRLQRLSPAEVQPLLSPDIATLTRLFPVLLRVPAIKSAPQPAGVVEQSTLRRRAFTCLRELLTRLPRSGALVLFIDDLQWGDADSAELLLELLRPAAGPGLLALFSYRTDDAERSECLSVLLPGLRAAAGRELQLVELEIQALSPVDAHALAMEELRRRAPELAQPDYAAGIARESGGWPFFIRELCRFSGGLQSGVPSLAAILEARYAALPTDARRLLEVIAVAGRPIDRGVAMRAAELADSGPALLGLLRQEGLVRLRGAPGRDEVETYHDRIRETIAGRLIPTARQGRHMALASAMIALGEADAENLAVHFLGAGDATQAAEHTLRAAEQAMAALGFERAARLYRQALSVLPAGDSRRPELLEKLGDALVNAGRGREAAQAYLAAMEGAPGRRGQLLRQRAAEQLVTSGHIDEGLTQLRRVLSELRMRLPDKPWQSFRWTAWVGVLLVLRGLGFRPRRAPEIAPEALCRVDACSAVAQSFAVIDTIRGMYFGVRFVAMALAAGEPSRILRGLSLLGGYASVPGSKRPEWALRRISAAAERVVALLPGPYPAAMWRMSQGITKVFRGDWIVAFADLDSALAVFRGQCIGVTWEIDTAQLFAIMALGAQGHWKTLAERLPTLLADAKDRGDRYAETTLALHSGHTLRLLADDPAAARRLVQAAAEQWSRQRFNVQHYYLMIARTEICLYEDWGCSREAVRCVDESWDRFIGSLLPAIEMVRVDALVLGIRAAVALAACHATGTGEHRRALGRAKRLARWLCLWRVPWAAPYQRLAEAMLATLRGYRRDALTAIEAAEQGFRSFQIQHYAVAAQHRRGELLGDT